MKKLVAAGVFSLAAVAGMVGPISASPLFPLANGFLPAQSERVEKGNVILAQAMDPRVGQLEEQIRSLNGRIEEMSYQLLQMQEQLRKTQEDNEYRFQDLESGKSGGSGKSGALDKPVNGGTADQQIASNRVPAGDTAGTDTLDQSTGGGALPQELGSIRFDENGNPIGADANPDLDNRSASIGNDNSLPGVEDGLPQASQSSSASLDNPDDLYQVAYGHVLSGDYQLAEREFRDYLDIFPKGEKAADANFWLGEAQYSQGNFNEAAKTFLNAHQTFSKSKKAPEMLLKLGMSLAALDNRETACATLREVNKRYPDASKAVKSKVSSEQSRLSC
ncbi:tol-pal system protein YbgF [Shinella sp. HZN7]|uniref:tol-pal system protein YbgF n=1 Tax=Shinella sp. (strain HZN7) TaxID=879274 RepID=UPI0007DA7D43|nr:tol-pal system protein YbgF [Shinella sp. HZN7]ANH05207.1 tol-pal system protein YbgF [Shinella sp. HZN7]